MGFGVTVTLTFALMGLGALAAAVWITWFPMTRCQKVSKSKDSQYNVCIRVRSHEGSHMSADGRKFERHD